MSDRSAKQLRRGSVRAALLLSLLAFGLLAAPEWLAASLRSGIRDAIVPGQWLIATGCQRGQSTLKAWLEVPIDPHEQERLRSEWAAVRLRCRQLEIENGLLHEQLSARDRLGTAPYAGQEGLPLVVPELLAASVLGEERIALRKSGLVIDIGEEDGLSESALVLDNSLALIDQGADGDVAVGQAVYSGRCVVGRIAEVGRWTSAVQLITDASYRARAQLGRGSGDRLRFGAEGILEGNGTDLCRLKFVSSTEPVAVGDRVYTGGRSGLLPYPMYFGKVVRAELDPAAPHWEIWVEPAARPTDFKQVHVLRTPANPLRLLGD